MKRLILSVVLAGGLVGSLVTPLAGTIARMAGGPGGINPRPSVVAGGPNGINSRKLVLAGGPQGINPRRFVLTAPASRLSQDGPWPEVR